MVYLANSKPSQGYRRVVGCAGLWLDGREPSLPRVRRSMMGRLCNPHENSPIRTDASAPSLPSFPSEKMKRGLYVYET